MVRLLRPARRGRSRPALSEAMRKTLSNPEMVKSLTAAGMEPAVSTPEAFGDFIKSEIEKWTKVARAANIKLH
jgi:tripartite-type tricarboxylate transporter receptor subunit TctC